MRHSDSLTSEERADFERNREGRLSSRQWLKLITEPLTTLLLLSLPLILIAGRYGAAGRILVLALVAGFALTVALRALRFARVKLRYRVLFAEPPQARWKLWRRTSLSTKTGEPLRFHHRLALKSKLKPDQALHVYYIEAGERRILLSLLPQKHAQADLAEPSDSFERAGGVVFAE